MLCYMYACHIHSVAPVTNDAMLVFAAAIQGWAEQPKEDYTGRSYESNSCH